VSRFLFVVGVSVALASTPGVAQQATPELADGPGKPLVTRVCGECHDAASHITKFRKTETEWADTITDMQNRGMMADDKDLEVILAYLTKQYGPKGARVASAQRSAGGHAHQPQEMRRVR
jgi:hypothetical protein